MKAAILFVTPGLEGAQLLLGRDRERAGGVVDSAPFTPVGTAGRATT
jgi:hypothetical protein